MVRSCVVPFAAFAAALTFAPSLSFAQALVVTNDDSPMPRTWRPPTGQAFTITSLDINANVRDRGAEVTVSQSFRNDSQRDQEVQFLFPLPAEAAVDDMTLLVNGEEFPAKLLTAEQARQRYEAIVRSKKDPALLEFIGGQCFQTSVFPVPVGQERTVTVHYTRLLPTDFGVADLALPLSATKLSAKPVSNVNVAVHIEAEGLKSIYSPTHPVQIERPSADHAQIAWKATNVTPDQDFRLIFDVTEGDTDIGGRLLTYRPDDSEDGFFLFLATPMTTARPDSKEESSKTVLFVLDRSGSMTGVKIGQARDAMQFVLGNLNSRDAFNILTYANNNTLFQPELSQASADVLAKAQSFAAGVAAGGGTNIHGALTEALNQTGDGSQPTYMLFLTDGRPTVGIKAPLEIAKAVRDANSKNVRIISFGVGENVNSKLLDRLSTDNGGFSSYVKPSDDIEDAISKVFRRLTSPVLVDAELEFEFKKEPGVTPTNFVYPGGTVDLFAGQELIVVGRYRQAGRATAKLVGRVGDKETSFEFPAKFARKQTDSRLAFVEKLWATRRIGDLINQMDLNGKNDELVEELVALSTKHGILTPYTSFLADEETNVGDVIASRRRAGRSLEALEAESGASGFSQRGVKSTYNLADRYAAPAASNEVQQQAQEFDGALDFGGFIQKGYHSQSGPASGGGYGGGVAPGRDGVAGSIPEELRVPTKPMSEREVAAKFAPKLEDAAGTTLYRRGNQLVTSETAKLDPEKDEIEEVERFTPAYFELVKANTPAQNALLSRQAEGDELLIRLRGVNYRIK